MSHQIHLAQMADDMLLVNTAADDPSYIRVGVKALIADQDRILLIKEQRNDGSMFWTLPGGGIKADESLTKGLKRELAEELNCRISVGDLVTTCDYEHSTWEQTVTVYRVLGCELKDTPDPNTAAGILEYEWRQPTNLPAGTLSPFRRLLKNTTAELLSSYP